MTAWPSRTCLNVESGTGAWWEVCMLMGKIGPLEMHEAMFVLGAFFMLLGIIGTVVAAYKGIETKIGSIDFRWRMAAFVVGLGFVVWGFLWRPKPSIDVVPVGTIVAWPTEKPPPDGWMICAGQSFDDKWSDEVKTALRAVLDPQVYGEDTLPDYRGYFLRGANDPDGAGPLDEGKFPDTGKLRDPNDDIRVPRGSKTARVGSTQGGATAQANNLFKAAPSSHKHYIPTWEGPDSNAKLKGVNISVANTTVLYGTRVHDPKGYETGDEEVPHGHDIVNGDLETRPINVYVNWIIKVK